MKTSPFLDEIRAEGRVEGRAEGRLEGRAEEARVLLMHLGRLKFGRAPARKQQKILESISDLAQLESLAERLLSVDSWAVLLGEV